MGQIHRQSVLVTIALLWLSHIVAFAGTNTEAMGSPKQRVFVLTDISNEPDDEESLVRFLVYANEYDIEGLVATTSTYLRKGTREDLIRRQLKAYGQVRGNLAKHADGYPAEGKLQAVTATGQAAYGMAAVGDGKTSAGSRLLLTALDKKDDRPLWISVWGGANTLAQALLDARKNRSPQDLAKLIAKLRVYTISDQDDAGSWLRREFPKLFISSLPATLAENSTVGLHGPVFPVVVIIKNETDPTEDRGPSTREVNDSRDSYC